jgi:hypothetical protein
MAAGFKSGERVRFVAGNGKTYEGVMVNAAYYPGGNRAGKHYRVRVDGGMVATVFATGPVGKTVERVEG